MTLYHFLKKVLPGKHSTGVSELIRDGFVEINGKVLDDRKRLREGDFISIDVQAMQQAKKRRTADELDVLYRDEAMLCVAKPAGISVIPDRRQVGKTVVQICRDMMSKENLLPKPVHRLDKWTSGVLMLALEKRFVEPLGRLFSDRKVKKSYIAFVRGRPNPSSGVIEAPIGPDSNRMTRMEVGGSKAKPAITRYKTELAWQGFTSLMVMPETGRTHQIRVHLAHIGNPVLCDSLYGGGDTFFLSEIKLDYKLRKGKKEKPILSRQALHAFRLEFQSPASNKQVVVEAPLPKELDVLEKKLIRYSDPAR